MAIVFNQATTNAVASGSTLNLTHTASGSDRIFIVGVMAIHDGADNLTSITYDGGADFKSNVIYNYDRGSGRRLAMYYLVNPPTTTNATVTATFGTSIPFGIILSGASYTGVDQTNPINTQNKQDNLSSSSATASVTTTVDNAWLVSLGYFNDTNVPTAGTNTTKRTSSTYTNSFYDIYDSNGAQTPTGSYSQTINVSVATFNSILVAAMAPVSASVSTPLKSSLLLAI